jgi:PAS domain S-box-containing protein
LRQSEEKFEKAFRSSPNGMSITEIDTGRFIEVNESMCRLYNGKKDEFVGHTSLELGMWENPADRQRVVELLRSEGRVGEMNVRGRTRNGEARTFQLSAEMIEIGGKKYMLIVLYDITARLKIEESLEKSHHQLRALTSRLQNLREEERTHLAREIHDHLGQLLTALKLDLRLVERKLVALGDTELRTVLNAKLTSATGLTDQIITSVQKIAAELRPAILDRIGLEAAIEVEAREFQDRTGLQCTWTLPEAPLGVTPDQATAVFRIFQELLTNIARHARATSVNVRLSRQNGSLQLEVKDDGVGITSEHLNAPQSLGLLGMHERAEILGGSIEFGPNAGKGTAVVLQIPLNKRQMK